MRALVKPPRHVEAWVVTQVCVCVQVRDDPSQRRLSILQGSRQIDLLVPKTDTTHATVTFSKQGTLDDGDLPLLGRLMLLSNDLDLHNRAATRVQSPVPSSILCPLLHRAFPHAPTTAVPACCAVTRQMTTSSAK